MARRRKRAQQASHERWLVSYADFITLLFAFFVVLFAVSRVDAKKMGRFSEAMQKATSAKVFSGSSAKPALTEEKAGQGDGVIDDASDFAAGAARTVIRERLRRSLAASIGAGRLKLVDGADGLIVRLRDAAFFESASASIRSEVRPDLEAVARTLVALPNDVRIEGHTDAIPIRGSSFASNWELSAARAAAVLAFFLDVTEMEERRMSVAGYGSQRPLASNQTPGGRSQNRRVDVVVLDRVVAEGGGPK